MDIKDLRFFYTVAKLNSVSQAAQELNYTQSSVTNKINKLETELDTLLFIRQHRGMALTSDGDVLFDYARRILLLFDEAYSALKNSDQISGTFRIGSTHSTATVRLPKIISNFNQYYPNVEVSLITDSTANLIKKLLKYDLDGVFVFATDQMKRPEFTKIKFSHEHLVLINHEPFHHDSLDAILSLNTLLLFEEGCSLRERINLLLHDRNIQPRKKIELTSTEGLFACVKEGLGLGVITRSLLDQYNDRYATLYSLELPFKYAIMNSVFVVRNDIAQTKPLARFIGLLHKQEDILYAD